ncbi:transglycosylase family protein [Streptomyces sp. DH8]|uniref:LysM peptidoglycan-binding domain-containing protein n=1 Tax=Streptomyces sp. DH8 TaxID=2857008 RepID=UPI001E32F68A|nr:transglycosylase family protein [Streptomyces sp. DH8]
MGSANGRHRRPRQAPAIVVAAGVTGSAIAIPLLGASGAHAADSATWDRVAECESGGTWSADLGNGHYGGLQFSQATWSAYGGTEFAPRADLASRSQQISIAEKVLDDQGPKAWPSCAVISGLAVDGGLPGVDPGTPPSADPAAEPSAAPSGEADTGDKVDESGASGETEEKGGGEEGGAPEKGAVEEETGTPRPSATPTAPPASDAPEAGRSADPGAPVGESGEDRRSGGKHRGAPAPEKADREGDGPRGSGRHASRGDGEARSGDAGNGGVPGGYTVRAGDNLWSIADAQELPGGWTGLYETNKDVLGPDPDLILPGQNLDLGLDRNAEPGVDPAAPESVEKPAAD